MQEEIKANVHKDFHGALSYGIRFLTERYGEEKMRSFLLGLGQTVYKPLGDALQKEGLSALETHLVSTFEAEDGVVESELKDEELIFRVHECPAIAHMKANGYAIAENFCEHTRLVNESICAGRGYACSVDYDQDAGRCVQRFWREES